MAIELYSIQDYFLWLRLHIMSGCVPEGADRGACYATLEYNLRRVIPELQKRNIVGVIEPINNQTVPGYFLNNYGEGTEQFLPIP